MVTYLSQSGVRTFRRCPREYQLANVQRIESVERSKALRIGSYYHQLLEHDAVGAPAPSADGLDPFDAAMAEELFAAHKARWADDGLKILAAEIPFRASIVNPETGRPSRLYALQGVLDGLGLRDGLTFVVERKTTSQPIEVGSIYWQKLALDAQVSAYYLGAKALGRACHGVIYDVARKPRLKPLKATPVENRKFTKAGELYSAQRDRDETVDEFRSRVRENIVENVETIYARARVVRFESEERTAALDLYQTTKAIHFAVTKDLWPRNPDACVRFGGLCPYWDICTGTATADDETKFRKREET